MARKEHAESERAQSDDRVEAQCRRNELAGLRDHAARAIVGEVLDHTGIDTEVQHLAMRHDRSSKNPKTITILAEAVQDEGRQAEGNEKTNEAAYPVRNRAAYHSASKHHVRPMSNTVVFA